MVGRREALLALAALLLRTRRAWSDDCPPERLEAALREIAQARAAVTTLTGPFVQERTIGLLAAKVRSTGTLTLVRPDRLRWELAPPDEAVYWILPEGLAYKSKAGQGRLDGTSDRIAAGLDDLRILLGGDLSRLRARYDLSASCSGSDPVVAFTATPKPGQVTPATRIALTLAPDRVSPRTAVLSFGARDKTEITFGALQKNVAVDPAKMRPSG